MEMRYARKNNTYTQHVSVHARTEHGYLLAFRKILLESLSEKAYVYHYAIDYAASY